MKNNTPKAESIIAERAPVGAPKDSDSNDVDGAQMATPTLCGDFTCPIDDWDCSASSDDSGKAATDEPPGCSKGGARDPPVSSSSALVTSCCALCGQG